MSKESTTISEFRRSLLNDLSAIFSGNEAYSISRLILEHFGFPEFSILKDPSAEIECKYRSEIKKIVNELNKNRPIQYILGETNFYELRFFVNEHVLIPRPETEELVSSVILETKEYEPKILDIGCGSGCIAISLAHSIPGSSVFALDIDEQAIEIAKKNATENNVHIGFIHASLFEYKALPMESAFDIIVSNPPYIARSEEALMLPNVTKYEPELALFVPDNDPLIFYQEIIRYAKTGLIPGGTVWVELNERFGKEVKNLFLAAGYDEVRLMQDIHGKDRFIKAQKTNG